MNPPTRPPPRVLFVHNGSGYGAQVKYLTDAGLRVSEAHIDTALTEATSLQPDIIVLDFECDGDTLALLKGHAPTQHIPVIALVELMSGR